MNQTVVVFNPCGICAISGGCGVDLLFMVFSMTSFENNVSVIWFGLVMMMFVHVAFWSQEKTWERFVLPPFCCALPALTPVFLDFHSLSLLFLGLTLAD